MNLNGRLRMGPKRKQLGFHRLGKPQQYNQQEQSHTCRPALLQKNHNLENQQEEKIHASHHISLKDKPQSFIQENTTQTDSYECQTSQCGTLTDMCLEGQKQTYDLLANKCQELQLRMSTISQENCHLKAQLQVKQQLAKKVKVLECQLINSDREHYQKELNRLRRQCENLQIQCNDYKSQLSQVKQQQQQRDTIVTNKSDDIKNLQKQIERQRISNAEVKARFSEQERALRIALEQSEASNQMLCNKIQQMTRHLERQQSSHKEKVNIIEGLNQKVEVLTSRGRDSQNKCIQIRKNFQEQIACHSKKLFQAEQSHKKTVRESQNVISRLSTDIQSLKAQEAERQINCQSQRGQKNQEDVERQLRIVRLEQQLKQVNISMESKDKIINEFQQKFKTYFSPDQYKGLERRCKELQEKRLSSAKYYEEKLYKYQKENDQLRLQNINSVNTNTSGSASFDEVIKNTMQESQSLRKEIKRMTEALANSKEQAAQVRLKEKAYLNQLEILRKKTQSSSKNYEIELEVEKQKMINEAQSLRRRLSTSQTRLEYKIGECRQKDDFIKSVIVGKTAPLDRQFILSELERIFASNKSC